MIFTVEISCYPLSENYLEIVDSFIVAMNQYPDLKVVTHHSSTLVIGPSSSVFPALEKEIQNSFETYGKASFVMKVLGGDLTQSVDISPYAQ
ncbi:MAG: hypothetical protein EP346_13765 [Bacteroidetes bacterium]|uniref:Thiamin/hydroxymethyl pyrimidine-binding YkoF putative domain-containing protein n=1 Tax=Phaeocystidibacter marisrubri TaxID=1577780 RepID=A0A6L3ZE34_9FLAO|nr:hypothetical protein [Phaeocystidibacter marisrubri]KAB2816081.1 hypothetical protein F8C82_10345 [Phaeocystidibacter marisrubri]TNE26235.1 MAG: hypothetical protein EP346_13765 [Bacteroidota bacterium]GGH67234.1 hypothetical protein GCM10011318_06000 [Phaeocystidibacter marisrubri]